MECLPLCFENLNYCLKTLGDKHPETARAMMNMGACKFVSGGHGIVGEYFEQAYYIYKSLYGENHTACAKACEWLGTFYESRADTINARKYLWKSYRIWENTLGSDHSDLAEIYRYMGLYFKRFGQHDSAILCFNKSKLLFDKKYGPANFQSVKCLNNLADIYAEHDNLKNRVDPTYNLCDSLMTNCKEPNRMAMVMTLYNRAEYLRSQGKWERAIENMNKILLCYFPDFQNQDIFQNPNDANSLPYHIIKLALLFKAQTFKQWSDEDTLHRTTYLVAAGNAYKIMDEVIDAMRKNIVNLDDMLLFSNPHAQIYDYMSLISLQLFGLTQNTEHLNQALRYISKKMMAYQINKSDAFCWKSTQIPPEAIEQYKSYNNAINTLQSQYLSQEKTVELEALIINKKIEQDLFYSDMVEHYQSASFNEDVYGNITLANIREQLAGDECLVLFSQIKQDHKAIPSHLTIIAISKKQIVIKEIQGDTIFKAITTYDTLLAEDASLDEIKTVGEYLYKELIFPVGNLLTKSIIVIPSPAMSQLSFDALPLPNTSINNGKSWLIEKHQIRKEFSMMDFLIETRHDLKAQSDSLLAIAPAFNIEKKQAIAMLAKRDSSLINLAGALAECKEISKIFDTRLLSGFDADEHQFKTLCGNYPYLHISTHGVPTHSNSQAVQLAFSNRDEKDEDGWLNFYEILNLDLNCEIVVLSACKTGFGKANNGEGNLNLAWAFRQAGAKSAVISLWDVNDFASAQIMPAFYKNIKQGFSRPEALRQAKLDYIKNNDKTAAHPYYWAAFDYIGDAGTASKHRFVWLQIPWLITSSILLLFVLILFFFISKFIKKA